MVYSPHKSSMASSAAVCTLESAPSMLVLPSRAIALSFAESNVAENDELSACRTCEEFTSTALRARRSGGAKPASETTSSNLSEAQDPSPLALAKGIESITCPIVLLMASCPWV